MDDVQVHYASSQPARIQALAYTQNTHIHVGPGQEHHLAHEAWHVVQQKQGRVKPTIQVEGMAVNDDLSLEREANVMGARAMRAKTQALSPYNPARIQREGREAGHESAAHASNAAQLTAVVQRFTKSGNRKFSENEEYVTNSANEDILYVLPTATAPSPSALIIAKGAQKKIKGTDYDEYHYNPGRNFVNDCLAFAENLARDTDVSSTRAEFRAQGDRPGGTDRLFGQNDSQNTDIALGSSAQNETANPGIGEAYAIVRSVLPAVGETPYHVAAVVAKDGADNVTLEADASVPGRLSPVFDMYLTVATASSKKRKQTFQGTYEGGYTSKRGTKNYPPSTSVLTARTD